MLYTKLLSASSIVAPPSFVRLLNQTTDASRTLTLSPVNIGDMLVVMTANRTASAPTLLSGYTNILISNSNPSIASDNRRSLRLQYKMASSTSETINWTGAYGFIVALRNVTTVGSFNSLSTTNTGFTVNLPTLAGLTPSSNSYILAGIYTSSGSVSVSSPYTMLGDIAGYVSPNASTELTGKTISNDTTLQSVENTFACEFL